MMTNTPQQLSEWDNWRMGSCYEEFTDEEIAFGEQAPQPRAPTELNQDTVLPQCYRPIVRNFETIFSEAVATHRTSTQQLFESWKSTGTVMTQRQTGDECMDRKEVMTILKTYCEAWKSRGRDPRTADFCDALSDAMAEFLDDWGMDFFPWLELHALATQESSAPLFNLVAFYSVLVPPAAGSCLPPKKYPEGLFQKACDVQRQSLKPDVTTKEIWKEFMKNGRCRFHEHANGKCWRDAGQSKPSLRSVL